MTRSGWTDERIAELKRLFELGLSCSQIAAELGGVTRCGVIGKLNRLNLHKENSASAKSSRFQRAPRPRAPRQKPEPQFPPLSVVTPDEPEVAPDFYPNRVSLLDATESHCRWPAADDGTAMMVCGDPKNAGKSFCIRHCGIAFETPWKQRNAAAARVGRLTGLVCA
jgi:GcrA cell cycle regulator